MSDLLTIDKILELEVAAMTATTRLKCPSDNASLHGAMSLSEAEGRPDLLIDSLIHPDDFEQLTGLKVETNGEPVAITYKFP